MDGFYAACSRFVTCYMPKAFILYAVRKGAENYVKNVWSSFNYNYFNPLADLKAFAIFWRMALTLFHFYSH